MHAGRTGIRAEFAVLAPRHLQVTHVRTHQRDTVQRQMQRVNVHIDVQGSGVVGSEAHVGVDAVAQHLREARQELRAQ